MNSDSLAGSVIMVTGAASGIGAATAKRLASRGADVILHTRRNAAGLANVAAEIQKTGAKSLSLLADLHETSAQDQLVENAWNWQGRIDHWINNAGADVLTGDAATWSFEQKLAEIFTVDVTATMRLSRAIGKRMKEHPTTTNASIVNIGWDQASQGMAGDSGEMFAASKGAIMAFSRSLAQSLAPRVRVNVVAPGWIRTAWGDMASAAWQARAKGESLANRWGTPDDIAAAIAYLVSPAASFINGHILPVNGGFRYGLTAGKHGHE